MITKILSFTLFSSRMSQVRSTSDSIELDVPTPLDLKYLGDSLENYKILVQTQMEKGSEEENKCLDGLDLLRWYARKKIPDVWLSYEYGILKNSSISYTEWKQMQQYSPKGDIYKCFLEIPDKMTEDEKKEFIMEYKEAVCAIVSNFNSRTFFTRLKFLLPGFEMNLQNTQIHGLNETCTSKNPMNLKQ